MTVNLLQTGASPEISLRRESVVMRKNCREDLADDLKGAGSTVSKVTLSYTLRCHGFRSCSTGEVL